MSVLNTIQAVANLGALIGGAVVWKLYIENLKAAASAKDAEISSVEKSRDFWKEKAEDLEKRSPEFMEEVLAKRIGTREAEISRLSMDRERNEEALQTLGEEKAVLERTLERAKGFAEMLDLEGENPDDDLFLGDVEVVKIGEVGVDSGQLMITDPCYINSEWDPDDEFQDIRIYDDRMTGSTLQYGKDFQHYEEHVAALGGTVNEAVASGRLVKREEPARAVAPYSYAGAAAITLGRGFGELSYRMGQVGAGVVFRTAFGDGSYPIYGEKRNGTLVRVYLNIV